jgi:sugar transferase (PEP-CTERM/EpsH1 system associated)
MMASAGNAKLKVLFFSQRFPYPMDTGGKIRTGKLLEKLKDVLDITLISNMESLKDDPYLDRMRVLCSSFHPVPWKEAKKYSARFYLKLLAAMFSRYPFTVINDYSRDLETKIRNVANAQEFDLLVCDFLQPTLNVKNITHLPSLLFQHNVESMIARRHFESAKNPVSRLFWWVQWQKMKRYETETCAKFDGIVAVSEQDKDLLEREFAAKNVFTIPTGVDTEFFSPNEDAVEKDSLVFTGSMDWLPNEDAILFFAREIIGKIKLQVPGVRLAVVGRNPSRRLVNELKQYPEIEVVGWVNDVRPFISKHALYIIPLRIGGGTRIKVYEAMAMGKAVVSTAVGVEGLPVTTDENVVIADDPESFARAVIELLQNRQMRIRIERAAREFVDKNVSWDTAAESFSEICRRLVDRQKLSNRSLDATYRPAGSEATSLNANRV